MFLSIDPHTENPTWLLVDVQPDFTMKRHAFSIVKLHGWLKNQPGMPMNKHDSPKRKYVSIDMIWIQ